MTLLGMESFDIQTIGDLQTYGKYHSAGFIGNSSGGSLAAGRVGGSAFYLQTHDAGQFMAKPSAWFDYDLGSISAGDPTVGQPTVFVGLAFNDQSHLDTGAGSNNPSWMSWWDYNYNLILTLHEDSNNFLYFYNPILGTFLRANRPLYPGRWHYLEIGLHISPNNGWLEVRLDSLPAGAYYGVIPAPAAAPTLAQSAGGAWTAQTAWVKVTYVNAQGETIGSAVSSIAMTANNQLTITSPPAAGVGAGAATGWYAYIGVGAADPGDGARYRQQPAGAPTPIGTSFVVTGNPSNIGQIVPTINTAGAATTRAAATGNTQGSAVATHGCRWHRLGNQVGNGGQSYYGFYDDVYWLNDQNLHASQPNNDFLGDVRVVGGLPTAAGFHRDFIVGGTAPYGGLANPAAAPGGSTAAVGGTIPAGAYLVAFSWTNNNGETLISPTVQVTTAGTTSTITATPPALPAGASGYYVYISQAGGGPLYRQTTLPQTTASWTLTVPPSTGGAVVPAANTTYPNYQEVNKSPVPGDTAYVQSTVVGAKDSYQMAPLPAGTITVYGIMPQAIAKKADAGARSVAALFRYAAVLNPTAAPTVAVVSTGGAVPDGIYQVGYTWQNASGETLVSPTRQVVASGGGASQITVTPPALPAGATGWSVYFSAIGQLTPLYRQAAGIATASWTLTSGIVLGASPPTSNTTATDTNIGSGTSLQNSYGVLTGLVEVKPDGSAWTPADVNNLEIGATITA